MNKIALFVKTTGKNPYEGKILSIHAIEFNEQGYLMGKRFYTPVNPQDKLPNFIDLFYGLSRKQVENSKTISELKEDFLVFIGNKDIVCYDAQQTKSVLERELEQSLPNTFIDLKEMLYVKTGMEENDIVDVGCKLKLKDSDLFNFKENECDYCVQLYSKLQNL
ncbi:MAG: 3'-5' exonuclease [Alphaproteobacteria bacterium]|nr:3'-5' exonuclease [Alphaproteobacteria bacterium]MBR1599951.1 3'-5' exonuclease [Alphaproteobacteria bacterium]MBR1601803.1 3'-5' exonuclease [Alphaproteobacteria bacterium]